MDNNNNIKVGDTLKITVSDELFFYFHVKDIQLRMSGIVYSGHYNSRRCDKMKWLGFFPPTQISEKYLEQYKWVKVHTNQRSKSKERRILRHKLLSAHPDLYKLLNHTVFIRQTDDCDNNYSGICLFDKLHLKLVQEYLEPEKCSSKDAFIVRDFGKNFAFEATAHLKKGLFVQDKHCRDSRDITLKIRPESFIRKIKMKKYKEELDALLFPIINETYWYSEREKE